MKKLWRKIFGVQTLYEFFRRAKERGVNSMDLRENVFETTINPDSYEIDNVEFEFWAGYFFGGHREEIIVKDIRRETRDCDAGQYVERIKNVLGREGFKIKESTLRVFSYVDSDS